MPVTTRAGGLGEEYSVVVPVGTGKEDLQQIVEDGMQFTIGTTSNRLSW